MRHPTVCLFSSLSPHSCLLRFQLSPSWSMYWGGAGGAGLFPLSYKRAVPLYSGNASLISLPLWGDGYNLRLFFQCVIPVLVPEPLHFLPVSSCMLRTVCFPPSESSSATSKTSLWQTKNTLGFFSIERSVLVLA